VYSIDLETMLQILQTHRQTGILYAELPSGAAGIKESCRAEISVSAGKIVSCRIEGRSGRSWLVGGEALREVYRLGVLDWQLTLQSETHPPVRETSPAIARSWPIPQRTAQVDQKQLLSWPRMHRKVYALVEGRNTVKKIADILSVSPASVEQVLHDLQGINVVVWEP
jgi:hypothetical protein